MNSKRQMWSVRSWMHPAWTAVPCSERRTCVGDCGACGGWWRRWWQQRFLVRMGKPHWQWRTLARQKWDSCVVLFYFVLPLLRILAVRELSTGIKGALVKAIISSDHVTFYMYGVFRGRTGREKGATLQDLWTVGEHWGLSLFDNGRSSSSKLIRKACNVKKHLGSIYVNGTMWW